MPNAFDMDSLPTPAMIPAMKAAGIKAFIGYTRLVTREVAELLSANDIDLVLVAEWGSGANPDHYTADNGLADADRALREIAVLGVKPPGIYFCDGDFDASMEQIEGGIADYRSARKNVLDAEGIGSGGYGNGANCKAGLDSGLIEKAFCWAGRGTNGTLDFMASGRAAIQQFPTKTEFGTSVDPDEVNGESADYWGFRVPVAAAPAKAVGAPEPDAMSWYKRPLFYTAPMMTGDDVSEAQRLLGTHVDGVWGRESEAACRAFQRLHGLKPDGILGKHTATVLSGPR